MLINNDAASDDDTNILQQVKEGMYVWLLPDRSFTHVPQEGSNEMSKFTLTQLFSTILHNEIWSPHHIYTVYSQIN